MKVGISSKRREGIQAYCATTEVIAALPNLTRLDVQGSIQAPPQYNYMEYGLQDDLGKELKVC